WACRLTAPRPSEEQAALLRRSAGRVSTGEADPLCTYTRQTALLSVPDSTVVYFLRPEMLALLTSPQRFSSVAEIRQGLATADDNRLIRFTWETKEHSRRWMPHAKGGGYSKWFGQNCYHTEWGFGGARQRGFGKGRYQGIEFYGMAGWSYSRLCQGNLSVRR